MSKALCNLPVAMLALAGAVAAKWSLGKQLEASKPGRLYAFFGAKTAAALLIQLKVGPLKWASPQHGLPRYRSLSPPARVSLMARQ